jgi:hypothetical protein
MIKILNMTPLGYYADGAPHYAFHTSFPSRGVKLAGEVCSTPEKAWQQGVAAVAAYTARDPLGNMGEVCGVVPILDRHGGGYQPVICTYHSNS